MMRVLKFGGSSVSDATRISSVMDIVGDAVRAGRAVLVCSAVSGCTDALIKIASLPEGEQRDSLIEALRLRHQAIVKRLFTGEERQAVSAEVDVLFGELQAAPSEDCVTFGELFSTVIIARKFACDGVSTQWLDSRRLIRTRCGEVDRDRTYAAIRDAVAECPHTALFVAPGFIASDEDGRLTTLGRGGSDYSAALYAAALKADTLEIWTDVPGMMTANPKVVPSAVTIPEISYHAALELAAGGAKVLYAPTVHPAMQEGIAINIKNTFDPRNPGTVVRDIHPGGPESWLGVTSLDLPQEGVSRICLVGESVASRKSASGRILSALSEAGIKPLSEVCGEASVFFVDVRQIVVRESVSAIHREFFESRSITEVNVFIAGYGAVGKALVRLIAASRERIEDRLGRTIRIVGVSDSRNYQIDMRGLNEDAISSRLREGESAADGAYITAVCQAAPRKSVFIDCTDDESIYLRYEELFRSGLGVVTSNRRSLAVPYVQYAALKAAARENGTFFRYDTTVGTSLPILESIASGANCSDGIESIEAVVSCTLNYVLTTHERPECGESLADLLRKAQRERLSETDPRTDLGGRDVLRKLLILAREAGVPLEESDVRISPMLGREFFDCPVEEFYSRLEAMESRIQVQEKRLSAEGKRQRFVAILRRDPSARLGYCAEIKMESVSADSPFYWLNGTENVTVIKSEYSAPLVIRGAGEGVRLAASGIIRDVLL